jgi:hypothetical protein
MKFVYIPFFSLRQKTLSLLFMLRKETLPPLLIEYLILCHGYCIITLLTKISLLPKVYFVLQHIAS